MADQPRRRPWEFSLVESPITPLRSRTLAAVPDGEWVMAMWRGARVSVMVIRRDRHRFYREGDYLYALGQSPNIPTMLGGHWDHAADHIPKKNTKKHYASNSSSSASSVGPAHPRASLSRSPSEDGNVGYLILDVANGVSLDKLVRDGKLSDTVTQIRVLDRIVAALVYAQKIDPLITHQDIHPGNILLVPSATLSASAVAVAHPPDSGHLSPTSASLDIDTSSTSSDRHLPSLGGIYPTASISTVGGNSDKSTLATVDFINTTSTTPAVNIIDPHPFPTPRVVNTAGAEPDVVIDEFGSPQKKGAPVAALVAQNQKRLRNDLEPKFPKPNLLPHIPKVEEVTEALTVLERVALHNELDASVGADVNRDLWKPLSHPHSAIDATASSSIERQKQKRAATAFVGREKTDSIAALTTTTTTTTATTASTSTTTTAATRNTNATNKEEPSHSVESLTPTISPFTVKIMDFASASEAAGTRKKMSWNSNSNIAGYCPPEKATTTMWRRLYHTREKERERSRDRSRRPMVGRGPPNGRHSPRPQPRRRSSNGLAGVTGTVTARSGSSGSRRKALDSETHALFADDNLDDYADTEDDAISDSLGHIPISSLTDRSGRRVAARGPEFLREDLRVRSTRRDVAENGRGHAGRSSSDGLFKSNENTFEDGVLVKDWNISEGATYGGLEWQERMSKIDVWSVGGLLYYMSTGNHPPRDAWAKKSSFLDGKEGRTIPPETKDLVQMCMQRDLKQRVCMRDVKRQIDSVLQGLMFGRGLSLLKMDRKAAFLLLDKAVGFKWVHALDDHEANLGDSASTSLTAAHPAKLSSEPSADVTRADQRSSSTSWSVVRQRAEPEVIGLNDKTRSGLSCLPLVVVRRVEWEAAARYLRRSEKELLHLRRALVDQRWTKSDVSDGAAAIAYLSERAAEGVTSAQSALGWIYRWGAGGAKKDVQEAMRLWKLAVATKDPEAANGLGLIFHHGRDTIPVDGLRAKMYYEQAVAQGYPAAAVNLGVMLHDGAAGLPVDGLAARRLYELAVAHEDAIAANNLALLLQHGAKGVERDAGAAVRMYEVAIGRGERHHACRNLAELLWNGAEGVPKAKANAVEYFAQAMERGDEGSRRMARGKLRKLVAADRVERGLAERCWRLVEGG